MKVILDTGPLVALLNQRDTHHQWAVEQGRSLKPPFFTCEAVVAEAHYLLSQFHMGMRSLNQLIASGKVDLSFSYAEHLEKVHHLMEVYGNVPMSFADACIVCLAELHRNSRVFTLDSDFKVYRKHRNRPLNLILP